MPAGKVTFFNKERGYGFIVGDDGKEYFFHINDHRVFDGSEGQPEFVKAKPDRYPREGDRIVYQIKQSYRGSRAASWTIVEEPKKTVAPPRNTPVGEKGPSLRVVRIRTFRGNGKEPESKTLWKGRSEEALAAKHPRTGDSGTDSLFPTFSCPAYKQVIRFEKNDGNGWVQCDDPRPMKKGINQGRGRR